jgi:hypothetical protein
MLNFSTFVTLFYLLKNIIAPWDRLCLSLSLYPWRPLINSWAERDGRC